MTLIPFWHRSLRSNNSFACSFDNFVYASSFNENIINSQEINVAQIESQLHNWSIPHMKINTIYQQGKLKLSQSYSIKIDEQTISLQLLN